MREEKRNRASEAPKVDKEKVDSLEKDRQAAASLPNVTIGRTIQKDAILFSHLTEDQFRKFKENREFLKPEDKELLRQIAEIMRRHNPVWGV